MQIAVIGAGVMGRDVVLDLVCHGHQAVLVDLTEELLAQAVTRMRQSLRLIKITRPDLLQAADGPPLERLTTTTELAGLAEVGVVIENITESIPAKERLYRGLAAACPAETIYGVNTSCVPIDRLAALVPHPERVIGTHFLNPVWMKDLVEVIRGPRTAPETLAAIEALLASLGKTAVVVNDSPGFVTNRVLMVTINEAIRVVGEGVAEPREVDKIFRSGFGHTMGPLATGDLIGLDTIRNSLLVLQELTGEAKYAPCPLLEELVAAGHLGKKTGRGLFEYPGHGR